MCLYLNLEGKFKTMSNNKKCDFFSQKKNSIKQNYLLYTFYLMPSKTG